MFMILIFSKNMQKHKKFDVTSKKVFKDMTDSRLSIKVYDLMEIDF